MFTTRLAEREDTMLLCGDANETLTEEIPAAGNEDSPARFVSIFVSSSSCHTSNNDTIASNQRAARCYRHLSTDKKGDTRRTAHGTGTHEKTKMNYGITRDSAV
eukprot:scaffold35220_cov95-Skeletonema_marinoi.AAC.1